MNGVFDKGRAQILLAETLSSVFADMAFVDLEPPNRGAEAASAPPEVRAAIDVLKPISWRIELACSQALKTRIEETLSLGGDDGGQDTGDSILEMLNVAAGSFLTSYFGPGTAIKLELPQYLYFPEDESGEALAEAACDAEGERIRISLRSVRYRY